MREPDFSVSPMGSLILGLLFAALMAAAGYVIVGVPTGMHP